MVYRFNTHSRQLLNRLSALLPTHCLLCGNKTSRGTDFCEACEQQLPWLPPGCQRCAIPLADAEFSELCGQCLTRPPSFTRTEACWLYRPPITSLVARFKYQRNLAYGRNLAGLMAVRLQNTYRESPLPDRVTAVPMHYRRRWQRGFNQSEAIARQLSGTLLIPYQNLLTRQRYTPAQQTLDASQRKENLHQAFSCKPSVTGLSIAVVDDVMTTGATAEEISRTLLAAGATEVHLWCLARTPILP